MRVIALFLAVCLPAVSQDPAPAHPKVDQKKVDEAIRKGIEFLKSQMGKLGGHNAPGERFCRSDELVLWTFVHAGVPDSDADFQKLLKIMIESKLERTYNVALQAMILEEVDRVRHQGRIHQCAQFLVDNQGKNGQWGYGDATPTLDGTPTGGAGKDVATGGGDSKRDSGGRRVKPKVEKKIAVKKKVMGPDSGDNSNTQYAALGLRACHDAGITLQEEIVLKTARRWWRYAQHADESGGKEAYAGRGWCYGGPDHGHRSYGSMTAGAAGSIAIYDYILGEDWKKDKWVQGGVEWLAKNFRVDANPGPCEHLEGKPGSYLYYHLYALERAGILCDTEFFGGHEWYPAGARFLLDARKQDGSWLSVDFGNSIWDTCFAILFLKRATRPLDVPSVDPKKR